MTAHPHPHNPGNVREHLQAIVARLGHVLPGQAPLLNFVHHNTLHGYQHLPFPQALAAAEKLTGVHGYLPEASSRRLYAEGRINDADVASALGRHCGDGEASVHAGGHAITRFEVCRIALLFGADAVTPSQFNWQMEELDALTRWQSDLPQGLRDCGGPEPEMVSALWDACLSVFGLGQQAADGLAELPLRAAKAILAEFDTAVGSAHACAVNPEVHPRMRAEARLELAALLADVGKGLSLTGLLRALTGVDALEHIRPLLVRFCAAQLDEGLAAWRPPAAADGLYAAWRAAMAQDFSYALEDLPGWRGLLAESPKQAVDAVAALLGRLGIAHAHWDGYLERLALELPGWFGMLHWRASHPEYPAGQRQPAALMDLLAIRLFLDCLWVEKICRDTWGISGTLPALRGYFERNPQELLARKALFAGELPEFLATAAHTLADRSQAERAAQENWRALADMIWAWRLSPAAAHPKGHSVYGSGWRLFRLAQHLGLGAAEVYGLGLDGAERLLGWLDSFSAEQKGYVWLLAFERHYREQLFAALAHNHGRARWARRDSRPDAQAIFCMDDREEGLRRHWEESNPAIETLGAAGFFGVAMNWRGLDDAAVTALCPVVVTPAHEVREQARPGQETAKARHDRGKVWKGRINRLLNQEIRRNLLVSDVLVGLLAPGALPVMVGKVLFPRQWEALRDKAKASLTPGVATQLDLTAADESPPASPQQPRRGFTDAEQAERVAGLLRTVGLTSGFAPLVALFGHGSASQNNPHRAAYDCGACSGRHGGPNARAFAAMANRPEVRGLLAGRGIVIPDDTWFLGAEHNTCDENIDWFDLEDMPREFVPAFSALRAQLRRALELSAWERCRRFASAPRKLSPKQALRHVQQRAADFSQARPELGHATHAAAVVGRRSVTRGVFLDRRVFLISYDPTQDADGKILESILLAAGPVGAGINLEYYFSTVNNSHFGCGSKTAHNVAALVGVMDGASGDLRTGLPQQMVEIHEAMRLQLLCEAEESVLAAIYQRQPLLRELIGNGWLLLSAIHPQTGAIATFDPECGFASWLGGAAPPVAAGSAAWFSGHSGPLPPALLLSPDQGAAEVQPC
ncbi:MAG: DUF2309 domain-containing protein [Candidatus Methylumidiphilus sp.]